MVLPVIRVEVTADTAEATRNVDQFSNELNKLPRSSRTATRGTTGLSRAFGVLGNASGQTRSRIQNVGFQIQDLVVQLQGGTSATVALSQQLPQLASAFGAVGAIVGTGIGLAIPALSIAFQSLGSESRDLGEQLEDLEEKVNNYIDASRRADLTTGELREEFGRLTPEILSAADALADFSRREAQREIDAISQSLAGLFGVAGSGEQRTAIADFFDVNILLAFTQAQRDAREEARLLTSEFLNAQRALEAAEGNVEAQNDALSDLLRITRQLAQATGGVSAEEDELIQQIATAINETQRHITATEDATDQTAALALAMEGASAAATTLRSLADNLEAPIRNAADAAGDLATNLFEAARARAQIIADAERIGGGRGGDPRQFGFGAGDLATLRLSGGAFTANPDVPGAGRRGRRGAGGGDDRADIANLIEDLRTERELVEQFREEGLELLMQANEEELAVLGGFNEAKLRLEEEYQERLRNIKQRGADSDLAIAFGAGQEVLGALGAFNDKALRIAKVFGAAQALIGTYQGAAEALKLPFPANLAAAAQVISTGLGFVGAIRGVSSSGGGGGAGVAGAAGVGAAGAVAGPSPLNVRLSGLSPDSLFSGSQVSNLLDRLQDEAGDRGLILTVAQ